jgi:hypothetical protein
MEGRQGGSELFRCWLVRCFFLLTRSNNSPFYDLKIHGRFDERHNHNRGARALPRSTAPPVTTTTGYHELLLDTIQNPFDMHPLLCDPEAVDRLRALLPASFHCNQVIETEALSS